MRFVCESCRAQYMINDEKVGPKGVKVRCRKCGYVILVKRADAAKGGGPVAMSNDPDDALATQVMQTPLAASEATLSNEDHSHAAEEMTNPGTTNTSAPTLPGPAKPPTGAPNDSFFGADEDEIGAVFDQVLKQGTGNHSAHKADEGGSPDDRQSTRVIDADTVRKLAEESNSKEKAQETRTEDVPQTDWYVAINEKQTGPLTLEKIKEHWDRGEISPDSLCWRAGYDDWIPVSDVKMLNGVLAPKPPKPIVIAPAANITQNGGPAVMNVPVQSAFSSGGMVSTMQSQMQVPMGVGGMNPEETGSWKPSAANSLGSLLKDEMEAQARPPPKAPPPPIDEPQPRGMLDIPHHEEKATNGATVMPMPVEHREERPQRPAPPPPNPYLQNPGATYSAPAMTQYRPPNNRNLMIGVAAGGAVMLLILVALIVWLATRQQPQPLAIAPTPPPVVAPVAPTPTPPTPVVVAPAINPTPVPVAPIAVPVQVAVAQPVQPKGNNRPNRNSNNTPAARVEKEPAAEPEPRKPPPTAAEDDFDSAFGGPKKAAPKEDTKSEKKQPGYIPPAPGAAKVEVKESLGQSDIMEVVLANKGALGKCVEEQRKKDPGTSGKLLMKWNIQTSGKTAKVEVASEEFKGTPIANCVGALIKGMVFPRHQKQGDSITFPFKF